MIEKVLPAEVAAADTFCDLIDEPLFPQEEAEIARAVDGRQREFRSVRACARAALAQLGVARPVMVPGIGGAPVWPDGVVGSMTHCRGYRAAAVARTDRVLSLGVDAEPHAELPEGVLDSVTAAGERAQLTELAATDAGIWWDRLLFSAKESVYKAWYPLTGRWLEFGETLIRINVRSKSFTAHLQVRGPDVGGTALTTFHGRWIVRHGLIVTAVVVSPNPSVSTEG